MRPVIVSTFYKGDIQKYYNLTTLEWVKEKEPYIG